MRMLQLFCSVGHGIGAGEEPLQALCDYQQRQEATVRAASLLLELGQKAIEQA